MFEETIPGIDAAPHTAPASARPCVLELRAFRPPATMERAAAKPVHQNPGWRDRWHRRCIGQRPTRAWDLILGLKQPQAGVKLLWNEDASAMVDRDHPAQGRRRHSRRPGGARLRAGIDRTREPRARRRATLSRRLGIDWQKLDADMRRSFARLSFLPPPFNVRAAALSGGNLQRVILARELAHEPNLIVALYPTRGLDARSATALRALLREARDVAPASSLFPKISTSCSN